MKRLLGFIVLGLLLSSPAFATTYYVNKGDPSASDSNDGLSPTFVSGTNGPWLTLTKASTGPGGGYIAGDTTRFVGSDTYTGSLSPTASGSPGSPITFVGNTDTTTPTSCSSLTAPKIPRFVLTNLDHIQILGFDITGTSADASVIPTAAGNITIAYNLIRETSAEGIGDSISMFAGDQSEYLWIHHNKICVIGPNWNGMTGSETAIRLWCNHCLLEENDMSGSQDSIEVHGHDIVVRDNRFSDPRNGGNEHLDAVQTYCDGNGPGPGNDPGESWNRILYARNIQTNFQNSNHDHMAVVNGVDNCDTNEWSIGIFRHGLVNGLGSAVGLFDGTGRKMSFYNMTVNSANTLALQEVAVGCDATSNGSGTTGCSFRNNIMVDAVDDPEAGLVMWDCKAADSTCNSDYNLAYKTSNPGAAWGDPIGSEPNSLFVDPKFNGGSDFSLQSISPARDTGGPLTTVAAADTSPTTTLVLTNAAFFQDGWGLEDFGVQADCIAIGTVGNTACIASIDYDTDTITLTGTINRVDGDPVWLYSDDSGEVVIKGTAPDMGAFEFDPSAVQATDVQHLYTSKMASTNASQCYINPDAGFECSTTANGTAVRGVVAAAGSMQWKVTLTTDPGTVSQGFDILASINGDATGTGACNITGTTSGFTCTSTSVAVVQGDRFSLTVKPFGSPSTGTFTIDTSFTPTTPGQRIRMGNSRSNLTDNQYGTPISNAATSATESAVYIVAGIDQTIQALCAANITDTGAGGSRVYTISRNLANDTAMQVTLDDDDNANSLCDTSGSIDVGPGDTISIHHDAVSAPTASIGSWGYMSVADNLGEFEIPTMSGSSLNNGANNYMAFSGMDGAAGAHPSGVSPGPQNHVNSDIRVTGARVLLSAAPVGGDSWTFDVMRSTVENPNNFRMVTTNVTTASVNGSFYPADDTLLSTRIVPANGPTAARAAITYKATSDFTAPDPSCKNHIVIDWGAGTNGAQLTNALVDASTYGITGIHQDSSGLGSQTTFATGADHAMGGSIGVLCNNTWPDTSTVGFNLLMDHASNLKYSRHRFPVGTVSGTVKAFAWVNTDALSTDVVNPDIFTIFSNSTNYANAGMNGSGGGLRFFLETPGDGGGCAGHSSGSDLINFTRNTWYGLELTYTSDTAASNVLKVYDENLQQVGSTVSALSCFNHAPLSLNIGFTGSTTTATGYNLKYGPVIFCGALGDTCPASLVPTAAGGGSHKNLLTLGVGFNN